MKVYIGPYKNWVGPYQLADMIPFISEATSFRIGTWLAKTWVNDVCVWIDSKRQRKIQVRIDKYDTWNMDHTLGDIILPMLKQLKENQHGAPFVDDEDVPKELRSIYALPREAWDTDGNHFKRWEWVLDEMIFAFEHKIDDSWEDEFRSGEIDSIMVPVDKDGNEVPKGEHKYYQMKDEIGRAHV